MNAVTTKSITAPDLPPMLFQLCKHHIIGPQNIAEL
jgi:hypothetical protein